jgi:two-component system chemotaxis response regulator CheY
MEALQVPVAEYDGVDRPARDRVRARANCRLHPIAEENPMRRLLVVDDALFMRKLICGVAAEAGWEVVGEAGNGLEALELYDRLRPDLVTMDLVMPEMGGLEALRRIRAQDPGARVVVVTALDQKQALMDSIREGAIDFIVKPFERQRVLNLLAKLGG